MTESSPAEAVVDEVSDDSTALSLAEMAKRGRPTRSDDTVVIEGGRRATLEEVQAYIAADAASRIDG